MNAEEILEKIESLPSGGLTTKTIRGKAYTYYQWTENGKQRSRIVKEDEYENLKKQIEERKTLQEEQRESLKSLLPGYNKKVISRIFRCLVEAKGLGDYHNRLQKRLCAEQCREIYTKTKHLVACG